MKKNNDLTLAKIESLLLAQKKILNVEELSDYTGFSKSYIYKLVSAGALPYSRPNGKILFFNREKIDEWLLGNPDVSLNDIEQEAIDYVNRNTWKGGSTR